MAEETVASIAATEKKDVAVIKAQQASNAEDANAVITTLDKVQEFKRFIIAILLIGILGWSVGLMSIGMVILMWQGNFESAIEAAKWLISLLVGLMGAIIGFYFGSNVVAAKSAD